MIRGLIRTMTKMASAIWKRVMLGLGCGFIPVVLDFAEVVVDLIVDRPERPALGEDDPCVADELRRNLELDPSGRHLIHGGTAHPFAFQERGDSLGLESDAGRGDGQTIGELR